MQAYRMKFQVNQRVQGTGNIRETPRLAKQFKILSVRPHIFPWILLLPCIFAVSKLHQICIRNGSLKPYYGREASGEI